MTDSDETKQVSDYLTVSRHLRPCHQAIDMRGRVGSACTRYLINDRVHFLDDASFKLFEEGLKRHRGVLTMETFETIVDSLQTRRRASPAPEADAQPTPVVPEPEPVESPSAAVECIAFGFFAQRREPRVQYVCEVQLHAAGQMARGVTFDLSVNGARVSLQDDVSVGVGAIVAVSFMGLQASARGVDVYDIPYQVVRKNYVDNALVLGLRRVETRRFSPFVQFIGALIARHDTERRPDDDDDYRTALAWYYERLFAEHSTQIPFFVGRGEIDGWFVDAVAVSPGNRYLLPVFTTAEDNYDFTPLCLPDRLRALAEGRSLLLAMYRECSGPDNVARIHSATDLDYASAADFMRFVRHACTRPAFCLALVTSGPNGPRHPHQAKVDLTVQHLRGIAENQSSEVVARLNTLGFVGFVFDLTPFVGEETAPEKAGAAHGSLLAWVGTELRDVSAGKMQDNAKLPEGLPAPELIRFGYVERRREDRYLARTAVRVRIREQDHEGMTVDISRHGLRVALPEPVDVRRGSPVSVGLTSVQKKRNALDLMDVSYRVVGQRSMDDGALLMLERVTVGPDSRLDDFFAELIRNNRYKLRIDTGDSVNAALSGLYEAVFAVNTPAIAFFIGRDRAEGVCLQYLGAADTAMAEDVAGLFGHELVKSIYDAVQLSARRDARVPFQFLAYASPADAARAQDKGPLRVVRDFDFEDAAARAAFLSDLRADPDWRVWRVSATMPEPLNDRLFDQLLDGIRSRSKHRAINLSDSVNSVVVCGEILDITDVFRKLL